ncbi:hypothetical protein E2562_021235 [Oryza meyeriana var. granulata]|uniref:non-specific serine/threonine protein kinase n=1 Tax=Oryza meyeriana var. granulata TaxID=110450 RepID=A0A6G1DZ65_9ORYZ|nr:hypothetical protein E2562_021235 [Oryza meyeriana var. granulata]
MHCDIKPQNIHLDASFVPKVADFGLAKLIGHDFSRVLTSMRGTLGYLAPEWLSGQAITSKADVFSYGMMLFEIISGKRNMEHGASTRSSDDFFPLLVAEVLPTGEVHRLLDPKLVGDANLEELDRACKAACWCIQNHPDCRPSMREIIQILEGLKHVEMPPVPRSPVAVLLDSGNLVVRHELNTSEVLWQSFDDFTDTWLPGNWTGNEYTGVPELSPSNGYPNSAYMLQFVDNDHETYFTYTIKSDAQILSRAIIDVSDETGTLTYDIEFRRGICMGMGKLGVEA